MSTFTNEEVADVLRDAREAMNNSGAHWLQNAFHGIAEDGRPAHCSIGAIEQTHMADELRERAYIELSKDEEVAKMEPSDDWDGDPENERELGWCKVVTFNDTEGRTWAEIEAAFKRTEERLRRES